MLLAVVERHVLLKEDISLKEKAQTQIFSAPGQVV